MEKKEEIDLKEKIKAMAMEDTVHNAMIALPVIMIFEIYMIINWALGFDHKLRISSIAYLCGYISLLILSLLVFCLLRGLGKDIRKNYRKILILQDVYAVFFVLWAMSFTYVAAVYRDYFSTLIYVTIITIVPVMMYMHPIMIGIMNAGTGLLILQLAHRCNIEHQGAFNINFTVLVIISIVAGIAMYRIRKNSYLRQCMLEEVSEAAKYQATHDELTGLLNRRSFNGDFERLAENEISETLTIGNFDLNFLKRANDNYGHQAGDELIKAAGNALTTAFGEYGSVYRVGGDEYSAILHITSEQLEKQKQIFEETMAKWRGAYTGKLSISYGFVIAGERNDLSLREMEVEADRLMYEMKQLHHAEL